MKAITSVSIDVDLKRAIKTKGLNVSEVLDEALRSKLAFINEDYDELDRQKISKELEIITKKKAEIDQKYAFLEQKVAFFEQKRLENDKKRLENDQKIAENQKKCLECGNIIEENLKNHKFPKGIVCNSCFMTSKDSRGWE